MRYFFIILFSVITFYAQSQVTITDATARFFLERDELATLLEQRIFIKDSLLVNKNKELINMGVIIKAYKKDSTRFEEAIVVMDSIVTDKNKLIKAEKKYVRKLENQRDIAVGTGTGLVIGTAFGQPLIGGAVGAGVALVRNLFKKRAR